MARQMFKLVDEDTGRCMQMLLSQTKTNQSVRWANLTAIDNPYPRMTFPFNEAEKYYDKHGHVQ